MKKEDFVSTLVMTAVSILMLVGVTIAWYTAVFAKPTVTGMQMNAVEQGDIKIALEPGGEDIAVLKENNDPNDEYVKIGLEELLNIENGQMAPGAYGSVFFYVTPLKEEVTSCQVIPSLIPVYEEGVVVDEETTVTINNIEKNVLMVLEEHFDFYADEGMTAEVNEGIPLQVDLEWDTQNDVGVEKTVTLYWKWHYEDPAADGMAAGDEREAVIYDYDMEDTWIGTHLDTMNFHFDFLIQ